MAYGLSRDPIGAVRQYGQLSKRKLGFLLPSDATQIAVLPQQVRGRLSFVRL